MTAIHISRPSVSAARNDVGDCPVCKRPQVFYSWFEYWRGWHSTCSNCGDSWQDGEHCPRPYFCGPWRKGARQRARVLWRWAKMAGLPWDPPMPEGL